MITLTASSTALVLIDLQNGIVNRELAPRSGAEVVAAARMLAGRFRTAGAPVVLVHVDWGPGFADAPQGPVDEPMPRPEGGLPVDWSRLVDGLEHPGDLVVTKHNWGAFFGTDLEVRLRRRGVTGIVLGGVATPFGIESTARQAWERNFAVVVAEDVCSAPKAELHEASVKGVLPRIARVRKAEEIQLVRVCDSFLLTLIHIENKIGTSTEDVPPWPLPASRN
ncbi:hypothetical protein ABAC460_14965 [Asticcacaulis sp. AC460]|uniref:hydrolase n=1 Tax=Asticcacaulis sp. AC460 TaxID=1282360 RepID=UPI0003C3C1B6|nr:hydrolase [Asticcacaulis sp. AC460]ESQ88590.1 hypothetical protein ABAC460_14965 [Asticcacaulis sp. AC460]